MTSGCAHSFARGAASSVGGEGATAGTWATAAPECWILQCFLWQNKFHVPSPSSFHCLEVVYGYV